MRTVLFRLTGAVVGLFACIAILDAQPAFADANATATAVAQITATATRAVQMTATAAPWVTATAKAAGTQTAAAGFTATPTPVPDVSGHAKRVRELNESGGVANQHLGEMIAALWRGRLTGGALTQNDPPDSAYNIAAGTYRVNGITVTATATPGPSLSGITTTGSTYKKVVVCINAAGTYLVVGGVAAASQSAALVPNCPDNSAEVAYIALPVSFTGATTGVTWDMLFQRATPASLVPRF